jgi:hypothetical protein
LHIKGFNTSIDVSTDILKDGQASIYSEDSPYTVMYDTKDVGEADAVGGIVGGLGGSAIPGVGTLTGAIGGAITTSTAKAVEDFIDWLFD